MLKRWVETLAKQALNQMEKGAGLSLKSSRNNGLCNLVMRYPVQHASSDDVEHFFYPFATSQMGSQMMYDTADLPISKLVIEKHGGTIAVRLEESTELIVEISLLI